MPWKSKKNDTLSDICNYTNNNGLWGQRTCELSRPLGLVVGATKPISLQKVFSLNKDSWILCPGIGTQGATPEDLTTLLKPDAYKRLIVPISRSISNASNPGEMARKYKEMFAY